MQSSVNPARPEPIAATLSRGSRVGPALIRRLRAIRQRSERELGIELCKLLTRHGAPAEDQRRRLLLEALALVEQALRQPLSVPEAQLERATINAVWESVRERRPRDYSALAEELRY